LPCLYYKFHFHPEKPLNYPLIRLLTLPIHQALTQLHNLTASLFGIGAGILGLESYPGFLFYLFFSLLTTTMIYVFRVMGKGGPGKRDKGDVEVFFRSGWELWTGGLVDGLSGFVLTWTLAYGLVRA
jgi:ER membrane protein complex subunit 6